MCCGGKGTKGITGGFSLPGRLAHMAPNIILLGRREMFDRLMNMTLAGLFFERVEAYGKDMARLHHMSFQQSLYR